MSTNQKQQRPVAIVTGATAGIGAATARALHYVSHAVHGGVTYEPPMYMGNAA